MQGKIVSIIIHKNGRFLSHSSYQAPDLGNEDSDDKPHHDGELSGNGRPLFAAHLFVIFHLVRVDNLVWAI